jgi:hypothetical protein
MSMDFIGPLSKDRGFNCIVTFIDHLNSNIWVIPTHTDISAKNLAVLFFNKWYCKNGLPLDIVSNHDKLFISKFWQALHGLMGVKLKLSTAYYPKLDGVSERFNKTINQCLRYHVDHNQTGWHCALLQVHFDIINTINSSTGFSPFQLCMGHSPHVIPPLVSSDIKGVTNIHAMSVIKQLELDMLELKDNLLQAKISQSLATNRHHTDHFPFEKQS